MPRTFTSREIVERTGASYRQVDYWDRAGIVRPSVPAAGSGSVRLYKVDDLWRVGLCKRLLDAGLSLATVREVLDQALSAGEVLLADGVQLLVDLPALGRRLGIDPPVHLQLVAAP